MLEQAKVAGAIAEPPGLPTRQLVFDYLAGEIFHKADVRAQQFLLHTAYLPRDDRAHGARALRRSRHRRAARQPHAQQLLRQRARNAARAGLPVPPDAARLPAGARRRDPGQGAPARAAARSRRAQMEQAGRIEDAVALYRECHDWERDGAPDRGARRARCSRRAAARRWRAGSRSCPPRCRRSHPWTIYWAAASQAQVTPREGRILYEKAFELFRARGDGARHGARRLGRDVRHPLRARRLLAARSLDRGARRSGEERRARALARGRGVRRVQHVHLAHAAPAAAARPQAVDRARAGRFAPRPTST